MNPTTAPKKTNGDIAQQVLMSSIKDVGFPIVMVLVLGWVIITYWIGPQTELIQALTDSNKQLGHTFSALTESFSSNHSQLENIANMTSEQTVIMRDKAEDFATFTKAVVATHDQQCDDHRRMLEKLQ